MSSDIKGQGYVRAATLKKIEELHAQIAALIEAEKTHHKATHPDENDLWRRISECGIEYHAHSPAYRYLMNLRGYLPTLPRDPPRATPAAQQGAQPGAAGDA